MNMDLGFMMIFQGVKHVYATWESFAVLTTATVSRS
jgi:hypothetical protein